MAHGSPATCDKINEDSAERNVVEPGCNSLFKKPKDAKGLSQVPSKRFSKTARSILTQNRWTSSIRIKTADNQGGETFQVSQTTSGRKETLSFNVNGR